MNVLCNYKYLQNILRVGGDRQFRIIKEAPCANVKIEKHLAEKGQSDNTSGQISLLSLAVHLTRQLTPALYGFQHPVIYWVIQHLPVCLVLIKCIALYSEMSQLICLLQALTLFQSSEKDFMSPR